MFVLLKKKRKRDFYTTINGVVFLINKYKTKDPMGNNMGKFISNKIRPRFHYC